MQSGDHDGTSIHSSGDVDPVHRALRNTPTMPWVKLTGNKANFTEDYFAWWLTELASKENDPKLAAKAKIYAEIIVDTHVLTNGAAILRCDETFFTQECGMTKRHVHTMMDNIISEQRKRTPFLPAKGQGTMGIANYNQEVPKHPDIRQEVLKPPDDPDNNSFMSGMSVFLEHMAHQQNQITQQLVENMANHQT